MGTSSQCPAWCERQGNHDTHHALWATADGIEVWLQSHLSCDPRIRLAVRRADGGDRAWLMWPDAADAAVIAVIFDRLDRPQLGDALRRCARIVEGTSEGGA